ncbi:hypothetical protein C8R46DRAFT_936371 [Mycena filopes]|nr:hypothetical protein C8R46DRAFT_936371 [Mycena filopes]
MASNGSTALKTVVVLGASYGGARAAQLIAASLPDGWRVVVVDRNSHANHVYVLPRLAVLPGHEHKAFIPYTNIFALPPASTHRTKHVFLTAHVRSLTPRAVVLSRAFPEHGIGEDGVLGFEYAVYALGSHMPPPLNLWGPTDRETKNENVRHATTAYGGSKKEGIAWLKGRQATIAGAGSVLVVGGGALGIQFATDIAAVYPTKTVTLLHSRARLLPRFDAAMHTEILQALHALDVSAILNERLDTSSTAPGVARTTSGRAIPADLVLMCTGQTPNTALLRALDARTVPTSVGTSGQARVLRTMQLGVVRDLEAPRTAGGRSAQLASLSDSSTSASSSPSSPSSLSSPSSPSHSSQEEEHTHTPYPHIFVIGDAADAFGAVPAGHNAYWQAGVAARNVLTLIAASSRDSSSGCARGGENGQDSEGQVEPELERYTPGPPAIKVSLGLTTNAYQVDGVVGIGREVREDLGAGAMWGYFGCPVDVDVDADDSAMYL